MKIWAHRGCSQCYPENTITSFEKAMAVPGLAGIELDIQLTSDGELVVIHDERVDRTTDGIGFVRDMSLKEIRNLRIDHGSALAEKIPTMREVLELLRPALLAYCARNERSELGEGQSNEHVGMENGFRLNIELKTGVYSYPGIEARIVELVREFGVEGAIVYSSFCAESLNRIHRLAPKNEIGVLDGRVSDCLYKAMGLERFFGMEEAVLALHPGGGGMDLSPERFAGRSIRAWFGGHLYPEKPGEKSMDLAKYEAMGVTDVFLNEPERYLGR